ncbi:TauD/TfdA family dioxygenase [Actinoplanes sp. NPDC024001]|uniref:TauD/TfdA dioxygenase family protein n=1 Tax=Actinoplanes sp. NPDC024001 TaxID=3154598 RepID=UPI0033E847BD
MTDTSLLTVRRVAGRIGAEVDGVDLTRDLPGEVVAELRAALLTHRVLFFRNQRLTHADHVGFARRFGDLTCAHLYEDETPDGFPEVLTLDPQLYARRYGIDNRERRRGMKSPLAGWHTDLTPLVNPPAAAILRAEVVPEFGGDTTWSNTVAAYESLSPVIQEMADQLTAEHRFMAAEAAPNPKDGYGEIVRARPHSAIHPVVRVHPETGERALFVSPMFTSRIVGLDAMESRRLLDLFFERMSMPAFTVRFRWAPGSVAFWDNRATAHLAPSDLDHLDLPRRLYRVTVAGDVPVSPRGVRSQVVTGEPYPVVSTMDRR